MMSDATEYALYRLTKGDRGHAEKRLEALAEKSQVMEYMKLQAALSGQPDGKASHDVQDPDV